MADNNRQQEEKEIYHIPQNIVADGTVYGGTFKMRNAIEAAVIVLAVGYPITKLPFSLTTKIIIGCLTVLPAALIALIGIDGESLSSFLQGISVFLQKKRVIKNDFEKRQEKETEKKESLAEEEESEATANERKSNKKEFSKSRTSQKGKNTEDTSKDKPYEKYVPGSSMAHFIPIKDIKNGIIYTTDHRYVKVIEVTPINFTLRSAREQRDIIYSFISYLKICPSRVQMKIITKKADVDHQLRQINAEIAEETNEQVRMLQEDYAQLLQSVGAREATTRRFFLVFEFEGIGGTHRGGENDAVLELLNDVDTASSYLRQCGNEVIQYENDNDFTVELLYSLFNRDSDNSEYEKKLANLYGQQMFGGGVQVTPIDIIAPESIDLTKSGYIRINDTYQAHLLISSNGYNPQVCAGWMSMIVNAGDGIDLDVFFHKEPKEIILRKIGQQIRINNSKLKDTQDTNTDFDDLNNAITSGYFLKNGLTQNLDFYYVNTLITITAGTETELTWRINELKKMMASQDIELISCHFREEDAFLSALPLNRISKSLYEKSKRNMLTDGVASCYPFTSYEMCDDNGILLGTNRTNRSMVVVDIFDSKKYKNANLAILGTSGSGKTFTMQLMALRMRRKGIQVFIIAPLKGTEFYRACSRVGGEFIQISPSSPSCINIMEIRHTDSSATEILDGPNLTKSKLAAKIQSLHIFFSLLIPDMNYEEKQLLDNALVETYRRRGITHDNESLEGTDGRYKEMPILGDLHTVLMENPDTKRLATIVNRFVQGSARSFNQQTNVDLSNKYIVMDISELSGDLLTVGMYIGLDYIWDKAKEDRTVKKAIFIDETWKLIGASSNRLAAEFVLEIFKIIRGYGGSAVCATQDINDFFALEDGKYGKGIINNAKTKIVLNLEDEEAQRVQSILRLYDSETYDITKFERGSGLISANANNVEVEFLASPLEKELITTDRKDLADIVAKQKQIMEEGVMTEPEKED